MNTPETKLPGPPPPKPRTAHPCEWLGCIEPGGGVYYNIRQVGMRKVKGHWCKAHDDAIGRENLERVEDEKMFGAKGEST